MSVASYMTRASATLIYLLAGVQLKGSVNENQLPAVLLVDIGERDHPEHPRYQSSAILGQALR